jgi:TonB-dependent receptor
MKRCKIAIILGLAVLVTAAAPADAANGTVVGRVLNEASAPLPGADIRIAGTNISATTDLEGRFRIALAPEGEQTLEVEYLGYDGQTATITVEAGRTLTQDFVLMPGQKFFGTVTVEGEPLLSGQAKALNQQKNAPAIRNIVAQEQIERFPDPNSAEATQRIPGVSIQRDQGEGRYVLIRGTEARLNSTMVDGQRLPSPEGDIRQVALDVIPSDLLESIEVSKALTPDMDGDAIGGAVNLIMKNAPSKPIFKALVGAGYNDLGGENSYRAGFTYGRRFADDRWGMLLSGSYFNTDRFSENFEVAYDDGELDELEQRHYELNRERAGVGLALDFVPSMADTFTFKATWNKFDDTELRRRVRNRVGDDRMERELKDRYETQTIYQVAFGHEHTFDNASRLSWRLIFDHAEEDEPDRLDTTFRQDDVEFNPNVSPDSIDPDNIQANPLNEDFNAYTLDELAHEDNYTEEENFVAQVDYEYPFRTSGGTSGLLKGGLKYKDKDKVKDVEVTIYEADEDYFLMDYYDTGYGLNETILGGRYAQGPHVSPSAARQLLLQPDVTGEKDPEEDTADYDANEKVTAAYFMAEIFLSDRLMILPGIRYEDTSTDYTSYEVLFDEEGDYVSTNPVDGGKDYGVVLPQVHLRYRIDNASNFRAAVTRSYARPNFSDLVPRRFINQEDREIELGNADLDPTTSWNVDVMYERFLSTLGVVSVGAFYKDLSDYIYIFNRDGEFDGEDYEFVQPLNGESATVWGVEFQYQNQFRRLPAPFDGFGLLANFTWTDSEAEFPDREGDKASLPGQSDNVGNFGISYEKGWFSGLLSYNFHGKYIDEVGEVAAEDIYYDDHYQLDFSSKFRVNENWRLFLELNNLTDEPLRYYEGSEDRPIAEEYYSWWGMVGFNYSF